MPVPFVDRIDQFGDGHALRQALSAFADAAGRRVSASAIVLVYGDESGDRTAVAGDREALAVGHTVQKPRQVGLGFVRSNVIHYTLTG
nr:hypothetical protein [Candidatus Palauibacter polyketidifaciens]